MLDYREHFYPSTGFAEISRQVLVLAGVEFRNTGFTQISPFEFVPTSVVDGVEIPQSLSFAQKLAEKYGFAGKSEKEEAEIEAIVEQHKNFNKVFQQLIVTQRLGKPSSEINKFRNVVVGPAKDCYFDFLCNLLKQSTSGFLVGDSITYVDLLIADNMATLDRNWIDIPPRHRILITFLERIISIPQIEKHIIKRTADQNRLA